MASLSLAFDILARDKASKPLKDVGDAADKTGRKTTGMGTTAKAGMAVAATAVAAFAASSVRAYVDAEQSSVRLDEALRKFPATNDVSRASFDKLNATLAKKTRFDDDATASGQAVLAGFKLTGTQIQELTPLLQDYAAKTGKDLPTAAQDLGKAVGGQGKALKGIGLNLKDTGSAAGNLDQLMGGLRTQVGGFATAEGQTAAGQAAIMQNQFGELQETVGSKLVPVLSTMADKLLSVIGFVERNSAVIGPLVGVLGAMGATMFLVNKATAAGAAIKAAYIALTGGQAAATVAATGAQTGLNVALTANPIGLIIVAIAGLVAGLVIAYKQSETFRNIVDTAFRAVKGAAEFAFNWIKDNWKLLLGIVTGPIGAAILLVVTHFDTIKSVARTAFGFVVDKFMGLVGAIIDGAASAFGWVPGLGGKLKGAAEEFRKFRDRVNGELGGINDVVVKVRLDAGEVGRIGATANALARSARVAHTGGMVSSTWPTMPGLRTDERPAILQTGERVQSRKEVAASSGGVFSGALYLDSGELLGMVRGLVREESAATGRATATLGRL